MGMKQWVMAAALLCGSVTVSAQEASELFTIATLNMDGLPQQVMSMEVNADGPGESCTVASVSI